MKNLIGQDLGRYHIIEPLGQGGMASVFKGYDTSLERFVAVKVIRTDVDGGDEGEFLKRFQREAKALAQLDHPYILKVLDYGEQEGIPYLVMPFVPGGTLKQKMGTPLSFQEAASLIAPIARALEYAHQQKIIHRDVKPANILISQSGAPLLSDFGIAKVLSAGSGATQLTATGVGIGTPDYMAPEQWTGESDPRTDVYSLGVVFYEMVTGRRPFTADTPAAVLIKHLRDPLPRPRTFIPGLPDEVEQVLFKALDKEPSNRYQDMGSFASALEKLSRSEATVVSVPISNFETIKTPVLGKTELHTAPKPGVTTAPIPEKKPAPKFGLMVAGGILVVALLCLVVGGVAWASISRLMAASGEATDLPAVETPLQTEARPAQATVTPGKPTSAPLVLPTDVEPLSTPIQSIDGLPEDVPMLADNNGDLSTTTSEGMTMFGFTTNLSFFEVEEFYKSGMAENGWELTTTQTQQGQTLWYYIKGESRMVMITLLQEDSVCRVMLMVVTEQP